VKWGHFEVFTRRFLSHFCLFRGVAKPRLFSFKSQLAASQNLWQPAETPAKGFSSLPNPKPLHEWQSSGGAARACAIALNFKYFLKLP